MSPLDYAPGKLDRLRSWLRSDMRILRWMLLGLYVLLIAGLFIIPLASGDVDSVLNVMICLGVMFSAQALLIFGSGTIQLCRPIRKRRLLLPVIVAASMFTLLLTGLLMALAELFKVDSWLNSDLTPILFWSLIILNWILWGVMLFSYAKEWERFRILSRFSTMLFAGSLAELLATVPAHIIVSRRPGCLVGLATMLGIIAGLSVMFFSFGPMIVVLFLRPRYRGEKNLAGVFCRTCGYDLRASVDRCPECGTPFTRISPPIQLDPSI